MKEKINPADQKITGRQAAVLVSVVRYAHCNCMLIPTGAQLAPVINCSVRQTTTFLRTFRERGYLQGNGIDESTTIATEWEEALLLMAVHDVVSQNPSGRASMDEVTTAVQQKHPESNDWNMDWLMTYVVRRGYIESTPLGIRPTKKLGLHLAYLRLLSVPPTLASTEPNAAA